MGQENRGLGKKYKKPRLISLQKNGRPLYKSEKHDIMIASAFYLLSDARCYDIDWEIRDAIRNVIRMLIKKRNEFVGSDADKSHFLESI